MTVTNCWHHLKKRTDGHLARSMFSNRLVLHCANVTEDNGSMCVNPAGCYWSVQPFYDTSVPGAVGEYTWDLTAWGECPFPYYPTCGASYYWYVNANGYSTATLTVTGELNYIGTPPIGANEYSCELYSDHNKIGGSTIDGWVNAEDQSQIVIDETYTLTENNWRGLGDGSVLNPCYDYWEFSVWPIGLCSGYLNMLVILNE